MLGWKEKLSAVLGRILILGFGVQILWGLAFALSHLGSFQEFQESYFLERVGKTLICDEYTGILYPFLIRISQGIGKVVPIPYFSMLYVLQLALAVWASRFFLNSFPSLRKRSMAVRSWAALSLLTLPMAMQCHLAVLPNSLAGSFFLAELGLAWRLMGVKTGRFPLRGLAGMGILFLAAALTMPEYGCFGGIVLIGASGFSVLTERRQSESENKDWIRRIAGIVLVAAVFLGLGKTLTSMTTREGAYGRMQKSFAAAAFRRLAWDEFGDLYPDWPQELREALTQDEIDRCNRYPMNKEWILGSKVDAVYGREKAEQIYAQMARVAGKIRFRRNAKEILEDLLCYGFAPPMQLLLMDGWGQKTLSGRNLDIMRAEAPRLTTWYVKYGYTWFCAAIVLTVIIKLLRMERPMWKKWRVLVGGMVLFGGISAVLILYYTMQRGGCMDYKNSVPVTVLWGGWSCSAALAQFGGQQDATERMEDTGHKK